MRPTALIAVLVGVAALLALRRLDVVQVRGRSMAPTLLPGERLLVLRARPRPGDVVLATDPRDPRRELIKRVTAVDMHGVHVRGDNPGSSTDTRTFGAVPSSSVRWRALARYWPPRRIGRIAPIPAASRTLVAFDRLDEGGEPACTLPDALVAGPSAH